MSAGLSLAASAANHSRPHVELDTLSAPSGFFKTEGLGHWYEFGYRAHNV